MEIKVLDFIQKKYGETKEFQQHLKHIKSKLGEYTYSKVWSENNNIVTYKSNGLRVIFKKSNNILTMTKYDPTHTEEYKKEIREEYTKKGFPKKKK